jgi:hypothetical protein
VAAISAHTLHANTRGSSSVPSRGFITALRTSSIHPEVIRNSPEKKLPRKLRQSSLVIKLIINGVYLLLIKNHEREVTGMHMKEIAVHLGHVDMTGKH